MDSGDLDDLCSKHMELPADEFARGCSFLHQVALGNTQELERIVAAEPGLVNFRDYDRRTALHIAASEGHLGICQFLVDRGARINRSDRWGHSPLDDAYRHRHSSVMDYLRSCGGAFGSPSQANNFISAASEGDIEEVRALMELGDIDYNEGDYDKRTALHLAAGNGHVGIVRLLCEKGADVNPRDRWGNRPLDDAIASNHSECVKILNLHGAKPGSSESSLCSSKEALLDLMEQYGKVRDGVLSLDWHDVSDLLKGVGEEPTDAVVQQLFSIADVDGDGLVSTPEFMEHSDVFLAGRPARIILVVGGPGSGKGMLCERLVKECGVVHLSSGNLLREEVEKGTALGQQVDEIMKSGQFVSSAIMVALMQQKMKDHPGKRILLDGFPRSRKNAEDLVTLCGKPELALHLDCDDTVLIERIMKRAESGERADDNIQTALQRIRTYHKSHDMTLELLREEHVPMVYLDCSATPEGVWNQLKAVGRLMRQAVKLPTDGSSSKKLGLESAASKFPSDNFEIPA